MENEHQHIIEGSPPYKTNEEPTTSFRIGAIDVRALTTLRTSVHTNGRMMIVVNLDRLALYQATARDKWP
jgi:hypothetical protein